MAFCVNRFFEISLHALSGVRVQKVQRVLRVQRVADCRSAAMLIKSALRDDLAESYGIISILRIGSLRRTSPYEGGRIKHRETLSS